MAEMSQTIEGTDPDIFQVNENMNWFRFSGDKTYIIKNSIYPKKRFKL